MGGALSMGAGNVAFCIFDSNTDRDDSKIELKTFAGTAFYGKATLNNNFWGFNIKSYDDFINNNLISAKKRTDIVKVSSWINLKLVKSSNNVYELKFVSNKGSDIAGLPDYKVTVKEKSGSLIVSNLLIQKGKGTFNSTKSLSMGNVQILNNGNAQIEKSKVTLQSSKFKSSYGSGATMNIKVLDSNKKAVKNAKVCILVGSGKNEKAYQATTNSKGIAMFQASLVEAGNYNARITVADGSYYSSK